MKKVCTLFCLVMVILSMVSTSALAVEPAENVIDLGDGFYAVETITSAPMERSTDPVRGSKTGKLYYNSTLIGSATISASFDISGSTVRATKATIDGEGYNGALFLDGKTTCDDEIVNGWASFKYNGVQKILRLSLSCTAGGTFY